MCSLCISVGDFKDLPPNWWQSQWLSWLSLLPLKGRRKVNPGENPGGNPLGQGDTDPFGSMTREEDAEEGARNTKAQLQWGYCQSQISTSSLILEVSYVET